MRFNPTPPALELSRKTTSGISRWNYTYDDSYSHLLACGALLNSLTYSCLFCGGVCLTEIARINMHRCRPEGTAYPSSRWYE